MPTAVPETIATTLVSRLEAITTAGGYNFNVASVDRPSRNAKGWIPRHLGIVVDQKEAIPNEELSRPGNPPANAFDLPLEVVGFVIPSDESRTSSDTTLNDMEAAIKSAIAIDSDWYHWGNVAVNSRFGDTTHSESADHPVVVVELVVTYRVSELNHYEVRL